MSHHCYSIDGFGAEIKNSNVSNEKLLAFLKKYNPVFLKNYFNREIEDISEEDFFADSVLDEYENSDGFYHGAAGLLSSVIYREEKICLTSCDDFDGKQYLLFTPYYPWNKENTTIQSKEQVIDLISRYWKELSDEELDFDYQSVENGG